MIGVELIEKGVGDVERKGLATDVEAIEKGVGDVERKGFEGESFLLRQDPCPVGEIEPTELVSSLEGMGEDNGAGDASRLR